jgi:hypothetical protein
MFSFTSNLLTSLAILESGVLRTVSLTAVRISHRFMSFPLTRVLGHGITIHEFFHSVKGEGGGELFRIMPNALRMYMTPTAYTLATVLVGGNLHNVFFFIRDLHPISIIKPQHTSSTDTEDNLRILVLNPIKIFILNLCK